MKPLPVFLSALLLSNAASLVAAEESRPRYQGDCLLRVDGRIYIEGPCTVTVLGSDGSFEIATIGTRKHVAVVALAEDERGAFGSWNKEVRARPGQTVVGLDGRPADSTSEEGLGRLKKVGHCWENKKARVCASRPPSS